MKKLLVLAGNVEQVRHFCSEYDLPLKNVIIANPQNIRGLQNPAYVVVGTFWERQDAADIWKCLQAAMVKPLYALVPTNLVKTDDNGTKTTKKDKFTNKVTDIERSPVTYEPGRLKRIVTT